MHKSILGGTGCLIFSEVSIRKAEDFSALKNPKTPKKQSIQRWTSLNRRRWWCLLYFRQEPRLNAPADTHGTSLLIVLSAAAGWCLNQDPKVPVLTWQLSVCDRHQSAPGPFWVSDFWQITQPTWEDPSPPAFSNSNIFMQHLPEDIVTDICTWAQTHSAAPALPPSLGDGCTAIFVLSVCCTGKRKCSKGYDTHSAAQGGLCFYNWLVLLCHCISH